VQLGSNHYLVINIHRLQLRSALISDINLNFKRLILVLPQIFASRLAKSKRRLKINLEREAKPANLRNIKVFKILQRMLPSQAAIAAK